MELFSEANKIEIDVYDTLNSVIDPELAINIIDMGLVYDISYSEVTGILVNMTLSSENCPMGDVILADVNAALTEKFPEIPNNVVLVWEPKWSSDFITPNGKKSLNIL